MKCDKAEQITAHLSLTIRDPLLSTRGMLVRETQWKYFIHQWYHHLGESQTYRAVTFFHDLLQRCSVIILKVICVCWASYLNSFLVHWINADFWLSMFVKTSFFFFCKLRFLGRITSSFLFIRNPQTRLEQIWQTYINKRTVHYIQPLPINKKLKMV